MARLSPVGGFLANEATRSAPRRVASAMTPLVLTVAMGTTLLLSGATQDREVAAQSRDRQVADLAVTAPQGVSAAALRSVARTPGVAAAVGIAPTRVVPLADHGLGSGYAPLAAQTVDGPAARAVLDLDVRSGSLDALRPGTVALGAERAKAAHVRVGDRISIALGDGAPARLRVVATYSRTLGFGEFLLPSATAAPHSTQPLPATVLVRVAPGASRDRVERRLRAVAADHPGLRVAGRAALESDEAHDREMAAWVNRLLAGLIFVFTSIAAINTLSMIALSRRRELALLRLVGATPRQLAAMARWEAGLVVAVGVGLGAAIAAAALVPFSQALSGSAVPDLDPALLGGVLGVTAVLGLLASRLPTRLALRARPAEAIGLRD
jgi:putative ABC transport system permease protein